MLVPRSVDVSTGIVVDDHALVFVHYCGHSNRLGIEKCVSAYTAHSVG